MKMSASNFYRKYRIRILLMVGRYQENIHLFQQNLYQACEQIGVNIDNLQDLITDQQKIRKNINFQEISPDSLFEL